MTAPVFSERPLLPGQKADALQAFSAWFDALRFQLSELTLPVGTPVYFSPILLASCTLCLLISWRALRHRHRGCRWRKDRLPRLERLQRWTCRTCGVDAFTFDGTPPKECKRRLRPTQL